MVKIIIEIETNRLILRDLQENDATYLAEQIAPLEVSRYLAVVPHPYKLSDAKDFIKMCLVEQSKKPRSGFELAITKKA